MKAIRKNARTPARPIRARKSAKRKAPNVVPSAIRSRGVLVAIVALSGAVIIAAMGRARAPEPAAGDVWLPVSAPVEPPEIESEPVTAKAPTPPEPRANTPSVIEAPAPAALATLEPASEAAEPPFVVAPAATIDAPDATIVGCLTFDDGAYRLKDATGADAPKSRSWKSGFLRKRSATIDVVDAGHSLSLPSYVGKRIEIAGTLVERELQARSLHRLADSCKK